MIGWLLLPPLPLIGFKIPLLSVSAVPPVSPAFNSGWGVIQKILNRQYISQPLVAQTISGTIKGQLRGSESNAGMDGVASIGIFVCNAQGVIVATLLTITNPALTGNEYTNTLANRNTPISSTLSSYTCVNGDRLVIEIGVSQKANSNNRNVTHSFGDNSATDLPEDQTTTTANNPWIQFSMTIKLQATHRQFF